MLTVLCPGKGHLQWTSCLGISSYRAAMWRPSLRDSLEERRGLNHRPHTALVTKQKSPGHIFVYNSKTESYHLGCLTSMETIKLPRSEAIWRQEFIFRNSSLWPVLPWVSSLVPPSFLTHLHSTGLPGQHFRHSSAHTPTAYDWGINNVPSLTQRPLNHTDETGSD